MIGDSAAEEIVVATRTWLQRAVIGLQLCPFAKSVYVNGQIRYAVSDAQSTTALREALERELRTLAQTDASVIETTLLIHPQVLTDFLDYNDFLDIADETVEALGLDGVVQIASFHPAYQFAGTARSDVTNFTNRAPYPMLHLLREASVSRAVAAFPDASNIYQRNIETMRRLGAAGWAALGLDAPAHPDGTRVARAIATVLLAVASIGCTAPSPRSSTLKVSYYAQDSAFASVEPLRVSVGAGAQLRSLRGIELAPYHPFLVSGVMPLDSAATLPVTVVMLGANADTAARAQLTLGPVEPATAYTLGVSAGGRNPSVHASSQCGVRIAVPLQRVGGARMGDSLYVSISGVRGGMAC